jgi:hypothetical protein
MGCRFRARPEGLLRDRLRAACWQASPAFPHPLNVDDQATLTTRPKPPGDDFPTSLQWDALAHGLSSASAGRHRPNGAGPSSQAGCCMLLPPTRHLARPTLVPRSVRAVEAGRTRQAGGYEGENVLAGRTTSSYLSNLKARAASKRSKSLARPPVLAPLPLLPFYLSSSHIGSTPLPRNLSCRPASPLPPVRCRRRRSARRSRKPPRAAPRSHPPPTPSRVCRRPSLARQRRRQPAM